MSEDYAKSTLVCLNLGEKVTMGLDGGPGLITQFSKCDFWNLGDFLNRNMWSKKIHRKNFDRKNFRSKNEKYFSRSKKNRKKSMKKSMKIQNFEISKKKSKKSKF